MNLSGTLLYTPLFFYKLFGRNISNEIVSKRWMQHPLIFTCLSSPSVGSGPLLGLPLQPSEASTPPPKSFSG